MSIFSCQARFDNQLELLGLKVMDAQVNAEKHKRS